MTSGFWPDQLEEWRGDSLGWGWGWGSPGAQYRHVISEMLVTQVKILNRQLDNDVWRLGKVWSHLGKCLEWCVVKVGAE